MNSLREALRDVLDQELQTAQEAYLVRIEAHTLVLDEKLDGMAEQLTAINALLQAQADTDVAATAAAAAAAAADDDEKKSAVGAFAVSDDGRHIYEHIRNSSGCADEPTVPFTAFVLAFETFFLAGTPMPKQVRRGLVFTLDRELSGCVSPLQWTAFYLGWQRTSLAMDDYLLQVSHCKCLQVFASHCSMHHLCSSHIFATCVLLRSYGPHLPPDRIGSY